MSHDGARIALIEGPVNEAIKEHGRRSCENHANENEQEDSQRRPTVCRDDERAERKGQRENGVRKSDQLKKACDRARW